LRRETKLRATLVKRRTTTLARLDALLELLGPGWLTALGVDLANKTPLRLLAAGYADPYTLKRLGRARLARSSIATPAAPGATPTPRRCWLPRPRR
jgi:hypothetical protein